MPRLSKEEKLRPLVLAARTAKTEYREAERVAHKAMEAMFAYEDEHGFDRSDRLTALRDEMAVTREARQAKGRALHKAEDALLAAVQAAYKIGYYTGLDIVDDLMRSEEVTK